LTSGQALPLAVGLIPSVRFQHCEGATPMSWIDWFLAGVAAACGAIMTKLVGDDFKEWLPALTLRCMARAVNRLTPDNWILEHTWTRKLASIPGTLSPFLYSLSCCVTAEVGRLRYNPVFLDGGVIVHFASYGVMNPSSLLLAEPGMTTPADVAAYLARWKSNQLIILDACCHHGATPRDKR
jgi:hypothetical protein